jgi:hypothetical protein
VRIGKIRTVAATQVLSIPFLLITVACAILAMVLPVVIRFEVQIDRAGGAAAATASAQSLPTVIPFTYEPSLPPAPVVSTKSVAQPVAPLTVSPTAPLSLPRPTVEPTPHASTPAAGASTPTTAAIEAQKASYSGSSISFASPTSARHFSLRPDSRKPRKLTPRICATSRGSTTSVVTARHSKTA